MRLPPALSASLAPMRRATRSTGSPASPAPRSPFALYVEGARDRGLVETWAKLRDRALAKWISKEAVILGGRQPYRALRDFETRSASTRALCVLDRDDGDEELPAETPAGFELFVWPRRQIESYLLVPAAVSRCLRARRGDSRVADFFAAQVPFLSDEAAMAEFDAKALFAKHGPLEANFGTGLTPAKVARAMRAEDLHADVSELLERIARGAGVGVGVATVRKRARSAS